MKSIYSLKGRNLFKEVYQKGGRIQGAGIRIYVLKSVKIKNVKPDSDAHTTTDKKKIKIAIALTKSFGKAHIRNKAKRRIRAICRELFDELQEGFCIIIRIDSDFKNMTYEDQRRIVRSLFTKAGLLTSDAYK